jgi:hypothetical protein
VAYIMAIEEVTAINITVENEPDVLALLNEFASVQHLKPLTQINGGCQEKSSGQGGA